MLTKDLDVIPGMNGSNGNAVNSGNDLIIGAIDAGAAPNATTFQALDMIDGGQGTDTLKLNDASGAAISLANVSNVEIVEVSGSAGVIINTSAVAGVTNLNVLKQGTAAVNATAAATTDIAVTLKEDNVGASTLANAIKGGKNVTVTATDMGAAATQDTITVGGAGALAAAGDVVVNATGAASVAATDKTLSTINVTGGKTISVTQKATSDAAAAAADTVGATITQGAVNVTGNAATTTVTVKQDAAVAKVLAVSAVAAKATTQEVTFTAAAQGDTVTLDLGAGTLMFTAKKALTAAEVASAFANLASGAVQGNASATLGLYTDATGGVSDGWSSGAVQAVSATQSKVVFSNAAVAPPAITTAVVGTVTATAAGAVAGTAAVTAKTGVLGVANGAVVINDSGTGTIKTISVDGYATASTIGAGTATAVLETLTLKNAQGTASMVVADTAATLALTVEKLGTAVDTNEAVVTLTAAPVTLNVTTVGNNYIDLTAAATETLNVSGTGLLDLADVDLAALKAVKVTETAGLTLNVAVNNTVTSVDTTGTTGAVTVTIDGDKATYAGGAGVDSVTVANPGTAISKAINLGGGNDRLNLSAATPLIPTVVLDGGDGTDTLVLAAADAVSLSGAATFEAKINSFERLEVGAVGATGTVNLDNLNDINYVITNGNGVGFDLTLDKMLSGATVELKAASVVGDDTIVKLADATGTSDVVKLVTNAGFGVNVGQVTAADVETINITANDTDPALLTVSTNSLTLNANKAATVTVDGGGNLVLTLAATSTEVTLIDASTATGALTVATLAGDTAATTVKGGSAADTLTAAGANDVLQGGAGKDTLKVTTGSAVTLTGGDGIDAFDMSGYLGTVGGAATITDFAKGETIKFVANAAADFKSGKVTLITEATFTEYVNEAMKVASVNGTQAFGVSWFEFNSNTFIVQNKAADNTFDDGVDIIVKLTGAVDLSASSFNEMGQGTLLFI